MSVNLSFVNSYLNFFFISARNLSGFFDGKKLIVNKKDKLLRHLTMIFHLIEFIKLCHLLAFYHTSHLKFYIGEIIVSLSKVRFGFTICGLSSIYVSCTWKFDMNVRRVILLTLNGCDIHKNRVWKVGFLIHVMRKTSENQLNWYFASCARQTMFMKRFWLFLF